MQHGEFKNAPHVRWMEKKNPARMEEAFRRAESESVKEYWPTIGGHSVKFPGYDIIVSVDPAYPFRPLGIAHVAGKEAAHAAGELAKKAFESWRRVPVEERAEKMLAVVRKIEEHFFDLTAWVAIETGKPIRESAFDILEAIDHGKLYATKFPEIFSGKDFSSGERAERIFHRRVPRGVTAAICSFNFLALLFEKVFSSLIAGCPVLVKPAPQAFVSSWLAIKCFYDAGIDPALIAYLPGDAMTGEAMVASPHVAQVTFTGSFMVGQQIQILAAKTPGDFGTKICDCEMGGNNAIIVCPTAVDEQVLAGILNSKFKYSGQLCSALQRLIIIGKRKRLIERFVDIASSRSREFGPPREGYPYGPLIDREAYRRVTGTIADLRRAERIAEPLLVEPLARLQDHFVGPAIFAERSKDLRHEFHALPAVQNEAFAPLLFIFHADSIEEAVSLANGTPFALTGGIYTGMAAEKRYYIENARAGMKYINRRDGITGADDYLEAFGGYGLSGTGTKVGEPERCEFYTNEEVISEDMELFGGVLE